MLFGDRDDPTGSLDRRFVSRIHGREDGSGIGDQRQG